MKLSTPSWLWVTTSVVLFLAAPSVVAVRGSSANNGGFLQELQRSRLRHLKSDSGDGAGGGAAGDDVDGTAPLLDEQCYICTKEIDGIVQEKGERPTQIRAQYIGGTGVLSRYQDGQKATCRNQVFPETGSVEFYGETIPITSGQEIIIANPPSNPGGKLDAETDFIFSNGISCYIHTSCSQPLVAGDQIGPFLLLAGNDCEYKYCGDGNVDEGEECDEGDLMPSATCKNCTIPICGDGIVDPELDEVCDEGDAMPSTTCKDCKVPFCGDNVVDPELDEVCDEGDAMPSATCKDCKVPFCGDNIVDPELGEVCDEGDLMPSATCKNCTIPICGDGIVDPELDEVCDEGDAMPSATCKDCKVPFCGDNVVDPELDEVCDEGDAMPSATCKDCKVPFCGDNIVDPELGEVCDEGDLMPSATCKNCTIPICGDGIVDPELDEVCDEGDAMPSATCKDCKLPFCGDNIVDQELGEECDEGNLMPSETCRDCKIVICGDGILDVGEECDEGAANGDLANNNGCRADCTLCKCQAEAIYDNDSGTVTIDFDMCGEQPLKSDFIGIYPCDTPTMIANQDWWTNTVCRQFPGSCETPFDYGYTENEIYVNELYTWFSWSCGSPLPPSAGGCQADTTTVWPSSGTVVLDPANAARTPWAFLGGTSLADGCYKVVMQREMKFISPPPYPTICLPWEQALTFQVPNPEPPTLAPIVPNPNTTTAVSPLEIYSHASSLLTGLSTLFVTTISILALYFVNK